MCSLIMTRRWDRHGMYGSLDAAPEVQRTINSAELTAFVCFLRRTISTTTAFGEEKRSALARKRRTQTCGFWSEAGILLEVEHVKAHRSKKEKQEMSFFERFVTEGNERAGELATGGAILTGGDMAQISASTVQHKREEYAASLHCLVEEWHDGEEQ